MVKSRVQNLTNLKLPVLWETKIATIINENIMLYEPWVETASSYNELRERLIDRGYTEIAAGISPMINFESYNQAPVANTSSCDVVRTMLRKKQ